MSCCVWVCARGTVAGICFDICVVSLMKFSHIFSTFLSCAFFSTRSLKYEQFGYTRLIDIAFFHAFNYFKNYRKTDVECSSTITTAIRWNNNWNYFVNYKIKAQFVMNNSCVRPEILAEMGLPLFFFLPTNHFSTNAVTITNGRTKRKKLITIHLMTKYNFPLLNWECIKTMWKMQFYPVAQNVRILYKAL